MKHLKLTSNEKKELKKRGFYVKNNSTFSGLVDSLIYIYLYIPIATIIIYSTVFLVTLIPLLILDGLGIISFQITLLLLLIPFAIFFFPPILNFVYKYFRSGNVFFTDTKKLEFGGFSE